MARDYGLSAKAVTIPATQPGTQPATQPVPLPPEVFAGAAYAIFLALVYGGTVFLAGSSLLILLAALSTIMLIFASRRATLRQVNANLLEVSEQLRQLQHTLDARR
jgi:hypothetical protein